MNKKCNCCQTVHTEMPSDARPSSDEMYFWECKSNAGCDCGPICYSTLTHIPDVVRTKELMRIRREAQRLLGLCGLLGN